jgi:dihydrolipoamide dehydrogenase
VGGDRPRGDVGDTTGWVKTIHESNHGELLGVVIIGPHATDLIGAGRGRARRRGDDRDPSPTALPHPTLAEGIKEAGLVRARPRHPPSSQAR